MYVSAQHLKLGNGSGQEVMERCNEREYLCALKKVLKNRPERTRQLLRRPKQMDKFKVEKVLLKSEL